MIQYREATVRDWEAIALLHTKSWQKHYRGILLDEYLDGKLKEDRLDTWRERLHNPAHNQYIVVAEVQNTLIGFACVYANHDPVWGSLLDNLHVDSHWKAQGIGASLLKRAAQWANIQSHESGFYLWVYEKNSAARLFYDRLGGENHQTIQLENPGGGFSDVCRYVWTDVSNLLM